MDETSFAVWRVDTTDVVRVEGVLDLAATVRLRLTLFGRLDAGATRVAVDLSRVRLLDAGSIAVLLQTDERLARHGGGLVARGARDMVLQVLEVAGVAKRLGAYDALEEWLADPADDVLTSEAPTVHGLWGDEVNALVERIHQLPPGTDRRSRARERTIEVCLPFAERLAGRFYGLGEPRGDLNQVAALGLVKAVDRYNPEFGTDFAAYATPTIVGELKRHFRDRGWTVRVPRRLQELRLDIKRARAELSQELGRIPTTADIAERLTVDEAEVDEAVAASVAYRPASLDAPVIGGSGGGGTGDGGTDMLVDRLGHNELGYIAIEDHEALRPLMAALPDRERNILVMRFFGNMTQGEIAGRLGISQMHVSRLLTRTLAGLRRQLLAVG